jgi:hypothetical protein
MIGIMPGGGIIPENSGPRLSEYIAFRWSIIPCLLGGMA